MTYNDQVKKFCKDNFINESDIETDDDGRDYYVDMGNNADGPDIIVYLDDMGLEKPTN